MVSDGHRFHTHVVSELNVVACISKAIHRAHLRVGVKLNAFLFARIVTKWFWRKDVKGMKIELIKSFAWSWPIIDFDGTSYLEVSAVAD